MMYTIEKPTIPHVGETWYDLTAKNLNIWNGLEWIELKPTEPERFIFFRENHVVISDYKFYHRHQFEIEQWCDDNCEGWSREGMVMHFPNAEDRTMFALRWAS